MAAVGEVGVFRARPAFVADLREPLGQDGEAEDLLAVRLQRGRQLLALEILGNERIVGHLQAALHGQVEAGGGLAAARHAHQDHVRAVQVAVALAVVVVQAEVDGLDAVGVFLAQAHVSEAAHAVQRLDAQLALQRADEGAEHVQQHALAVLLDDAQHAHVDQGGEDDGLLALQLGRVVDAAHGLMGLVLGVDEGQAHVARLDVELRQDGIAEGLGGDAGAVGDEEYGARVHGWVGAFRGDRSLGGLLAGPGGRPCPTSALRPAALQSRPLFPFPPCTRPAHNQNSQATACRACVKTAPPPARLRARAAPWGAQTRFQLLELSHVCTVRVDRPGRSV